MSIRRPDVDQQRASGRVRARGPERISEVMSRLLARTGYAQVQLPAGYQEAWAAGAGPHMARHSRAGNLRRGVLEVIVRNSTVLHELSFHKKEILNRIDRSLTDRKIDDLRFRVGQID